MANSSADFNYKVALASGLKSLQSGRLRQAEEQFRYLVQHFPASDGGYRGLAKVLVEKQDRPGALRVLLEGGAALAKADQRHTAIALYHEAVGLDEHDLTAHRRLAAALALNGEAESAAHEYVRYIHGAFAANDTARAQLEAAYALERMPHSDEIAEAARSVGAANGSAATPADHAGHGEHADTFISTADRDALMRSAFGSAGPAPSDEPAPAWDPRAHGGWAPEAHENAAWETSPPAATPSAPNAPTAWDAPGDGEPIAAGADAMSVEATAARYLAQGDPRGGAAALEAARRYIADGRVDAASDLLLQLIAAGIADHDAQRLLVDVTKSLGKKEVAKAKVQLLVLALRLDGRNELAAEVEQLAQAF